MTKGNGMTTIKDLDVPRKEELVRRRNCYVRKFRTSTKIREGVYWCVVGSVESGGNDVWDLRYMVENGKITYREGRSRMQFAPNAFICTFADHDDERVETFCFYRGEVKTGEDGKIDTTDLVQINERITVRKNRTIVRETTIRRNHIISKHWKHYPNRILYTVYRDDRLSKYVNVINVGVNSKGKKLMKWNEYLTLPNGEKILRKSYHSIHGHGAKYGIQTTYTGADGRSYHRPRKYFYWHEGKLFGCVSLTKALQALQLIVPIWRLHVHKKRKARQIIRNSGLFCNDVCDTIGSYL